MNALYLIVSLILSEGVGALSAFFSGDIAKSFDNLVKPSFAPPGFVFGPVWIILYALMAVAAYRVWKNREKRKEALSFYGLQLSLNFLWSIIFFRLQLRGIAFLEILILLVLIIITTVKFFNIDKIAGYILVPYALWVSFATILNYSLWILN